MKMAGLQQTLNHRDTSHADDALLRLNKLRQEGILCDVTVLVQGKEFKAHRAVLAACSDYFLNALCGGKSTAIVRVDRAAGQMTLELEHVKARGFTPLLEYAYTSNLQVNSSDVIDVLQAASFLQMSKVSTACSEFMRSNILWSQSLPRLAAGLPASLINGKSGNKEEELRAVATAMAARGITTDVSSLFTNSAISAVAGRALGQPPMLIPMASMPYEASLQQWAANMAGRTNFLSRVSNAHRTSTMEPTNAVTATSIASLTNPSLGPWPLRDDRRETPSPRENGTRMHPRKSGSIKMETQSDGETTAGQHNSAASPNGSSNSEPMEDSWQALQKLYSMRANGVSSPRDGSSNYRSGSNTPVDIDNNNNNNNTVHSPASRGHSRPHSVENSPANANSNNNNNNMMGLKEGMANFIGKMKANLLTSEGIARLTPAAAAAAAMAARSRLPVTSVQSAILQQQQLMAQHGTASNEPLPVPELPVVPANGQYMSVRRRTLQSNVPKPHQCQICGSRFTRFHNLKQHIKLHSGIKPYECDECGKRFTRNYTLRLHKMKHVGIRNFRCGTCEATFTSLGEFRAHLRITMHSHAGIGSLDGSPSRNSNASPEDMTTDRLNNSQNHTAISRYSAFDPSMLGIGANSIPISINRYNPLAGASVDGGSVGAESPNASERSMSPQDLSTKNHNLDKKNLYHQDSDKEFTERSSDNNPEENEVRNDEVGDDEKVANDRQCRSISPNSDRFVSSGAESANKSAVSDDAEEHDLVIDHQDDVTNDRPMSLVVDASA